MNRPIPHAQRALQQNRELAERFVAAAAPAYRAYIENDSELKLASRHNMEDEIVEFTSWNFTQLGVENREIIFLVAAWFANKNFHWSFSCDPEAAPTIRYEAYAFQPSKQLVPKNACEGHGPTLTAAAIEAWTEAFEDGL